MVWALLDLIPFIYLNIFVGLLQTRFKILLFSQGTKSLRFISFHGEKFTVGNPSLQAFQPQKFITCQVQLRITRWDDLRIVILSTTLTTRLVIREGLALCDILCFIFAAKRPSLLPTARLKVLSISDFLTKSVTLNNK